MISFNLLSEILFVQAMTVFMVPEIDDQFQSLERDSVCSSLDGDLAGARKKVVSIS